MESVAAMLRGVSILELCLIIAMKRIVELNGDDPFNFEMVYSGTYVPSVPVGVMMSLLCNVVCG